MGIFEVTNLIVILYVVQVWFEYTSVAGSLKRSNLMAIQAGNQPYNPIMLKQQRVGYFLEALVGAIFVYGGFFLLNHFVSYTSDLFIIFYILMLLVLLEVTRIIYSCIANRYLKYQANKYNKSILQESGKIPNDPNISPELLHKLREDYNNEE